MRTAAEEVRKMSAGEAVSPPIEKKPAPLGENTDSERTRSSRLSGTKRARTAAATRQTTRTVPGLLS
jgi:hypothetical protein